MFGEFFTVEDLRARGLTLSGPQVDYYNDPVDRYAVVVYGVPAPDRLYIRGMHDPYAWTTMYQPAKPGWPQGDERGMCAVFIPLVIKGLSEEEAISRYSEWQDPADVEAWLPIVYGEIDIVEEMPGYFPLTEVPWATTVWDLWPITDDERPIWNQAAIECMTKSKLEEMELYTRWHCEGELWTPALDAFEDRRWRAATPEERTQVEAEYEKLLESELLDLEAALFKEIGGSDGQGPYYESVVDIDMPAADLPPEQSVIWTSLQVLSQRNWGRLSRSVVGDGYVPDFTVFASGNRRLCPWY